MRSILFATSVMLLAIVSRAIGDDGTLIVLNKAEASASLIDLATGKEVRRVQTGEGPHEVAVSPDGATAVVADYGASQPGHTLSVIDVVNGVSLSQINLGMNTRPHGIAFLDDTRVIVTTEGSKSVVIVDIAEGEVVDTVVTGQEVTHMVAVAPNLNRAFTANIGSGTLTAIDLGEKKVIEHVETGSGAEGIDVSPSGTEVWVANRDANTVTVVHANTLEVFAQLECGQFPIRVKFTPDGRHVLVSNARSGEVAVFDAAKREEVARVKITAPEIEGQEMLGSQGPVPIGIIMPPNGGRAYVASANADIIATIELGTWKLGAPLKAGKEPDGMAWSPLKFGAEAKRRESTTYGS
jgi:YVTN family beta-propeller protein